MINNPYKRSGALARDMKKVSADVDPQDYAFFKRKFPSGCTGITDKLISTLYKKIIDELRRLDSDPNVPFDLSFYSHSDGYVLLDAVICGIQFGQHAGRTGGSNVSGGVSGIHQEVRVDAVVSTVEKSGDPVRRGKPWRDKEKKVSRTKEG